MKHTIKLVAKDCWEKMELTAKFETARGLMTVDESRRRRPEFSNLLFDALRREFPAHRIEFK